MIRYWSAIILLIFGFNSYAQTKAQHYVVEGNFNGTNYEMGLLKLILEASKAPGEVIELKRNNLYDKKLPFLRQITAFSVLKENIVMWGGTSKRLEAFLHPIRVPIYKGILGYRYLVIRKEDHAKFSNIKNKKQLATLVAGQGEQWSDTLALRANGFPVVTGSDKELLYKMLKAKHFDYFPRGIGEIEAELDMINAYGLMVEPHLMFEYPSPYYFFVNKNNKNLADRLEKGWEIIINNGSFDKFFFGSDWIKTVFEQMKLQPRYVAHLKTPDLPEQTPLDNPKYWLDISSFCTSLY